MSDYKPVPPIPKPRPPIDAEALRAETAVMPVSVVVSAKASMVPDRQATVTQRKSVHTTVGGDDGDLKAHILPHGKALIDRLLTVALDPNAKQNLSIQAIGMLLDRGWGKPGQTIETTETVADLTSLHLEALRNTVKR